jgi:hypothetical protein
MDAAREEQLDKYTKELRELNRKALEDFDKAREEYDDAMLKFKQGEITKAPKKPKYKEPKVPNVRTRFPLLKHVGGRTRRGRKSRSTRRR